MARGVRFALSTPGVHAFCTPGDTRVLTTALAAAADYVPMTTGRAGGGGGRHGRRVVDLPDGLGLIRVGADRRTDGTGR